MTVASSRVLLIAADRPRAPRLSWNRSLPYSFSTPEEPETFHTD
jgi:hypothetical protein